MGKEADTKNNIIGQVESFDLVDGISGWAFNPCNRDASIDLELCAGEVVLANSLTDRYRSDLGSKDSIDFYPGFMFSASTLSIAVSNQAAALDDRLQIRAAGRYTLGGIRLPTFRSLREASELASMPDRDTFGLDLQRSLVSLMDDAEILRTHTQRPLAENLRGYIEQIACIERHVIAFSGWCYRSTKAEQGALLLDGEKFVAAFSILTSERADLPEHALAFVGVLRSSWRPKSRGSEPFLFFGPNAEYFFRSAGALKASSIASMENAISRDHINIHNNRVFDIRQIFMTNEGWVTQSDKLLKLGIALSLDYVVLLPGFGALVEGWMMAGVPRLTGMTIKLGSKMLHLDPRSFRRLPRNDLAKGQASFRDRTAMAGFSGLFIGSLNLNDFHEPMLKVHFSDGSNAIIDINPSQIRQFDSGFDAELLRIGFASLAFEPFFLTIVTARSRLIKKQAATIITPIIRAEGSSIILQGLPLNDDDLHLTLDTILSKLQSLPPKIAIGLIADARHNRSLILQYMENYKFINSKALVSLTLVETVSYALYAAPEVLNLHHSNTFLYIGPDVWLMPRGWSRAFELFDQCSKLNVGHVASLPVLTRIDGQEVFRMDDQLFGWSRIAFSAWMKDAVVPFNDVPQQYGLPRSGLLNDDEALGVRLRCPKHNVFKTRLDQQLFDKKDF